MPLLPPGQGVALRRTPLPPESVRGGLLTQAAVLKVTANGTTTSPVLRGAWIMERILGQKPPPPPPSVPAVEPDTRGAVTIRQQLDKHRTLATCNACHAKIDPMGLAFENYDAIGRWRSEEVTDGKGANPTVDSSGKLPDGRGYQNADDFKKLLLRDLDAFALTFIEKLATYGLRRTTSFGDREDLKAIAAEAKSKDYRLKDIVASFVCSDLFQKR